MTPLAIQLLSDEAEPKPVPYKRYRVYEKTLG